MQIHLKTACCCLLLFVTATRANCAADASQALAIDVLQLLADSEPAMLGLGDSQEPLAMMLAEQQEAQQLNGTNAGRQLLQSGSKRVAWRGRMDPKYQLSYFAAFQRYIRLPPAEFRNVMLDPVTPGSRQPVLHVHYPAGGWATSGKPPSGTLFYSYPYGRDIPLAYMGASLEYEVYFPPDFPWMKGGKLPGFGGGPHGCGGGVDPNYCWSVRVMWRRDGAGEAYMYVPEGRQGDDFCSVPPYTKCDYATGVSLARGAFNFTLGQWNHVKLTVLLNDIGQANGVVEVWHNGERKIYYDKVNYREQPGIQVDSIYFATWFGGGDTTWGPPADTWTLFRNVKMYRADPPSAPQVTAQTTVFTQQVSETSWWEEPPEPIDE